jgi:hypothetical protein
VTVDAQILEELRAIRALLEAQREVKPVKMPQPKRAERPSMNAEERRAFATRKLRAAGAVKKG